MNIIHASNIGEQKMKLVKGLLLMVLGVSTGSLFAVEAPEMNIEHSIVINAPPEVVWDVVSDFNGLPRWLSTITASRIVLGKNREVGAIRELTRANGTKVQEKLIAYEPWNMSLGYTYIGGQVGATDYFPTITVSDAGNGKSKVVWKARFKRVAYWTDDPPAGQDDATPLNVLNKVYAMGLENLKKIIEEGQQ
ncbi:MAG TPA: SRPBCC family protein [Burkholderiales bacterium]|nr:SRPBCC family protein [Burkholderiales bacterium]